MMKITVSFFLLLLLSANAYAAHPLITDDTDTQGRGKFQIEINTGFAADNRNGGTEKEQSTDANTALSFGVADNIDLIAALPQKWLLISVNGSTAQDERGIGDITIEMKWRFLEDETTGLRLALKPGFSLPTGNAEKGLGSGARSESLTLMATREGRLGALHCNLGYSRNETDDDNTRNNIWHASVATEINVMGDLRAVLNTGIETNEEKGSATHPAFLLGGVIYAVSENLDLDLGLKCALNKAETDRTFLVGLASRF